MKGHWFSSKAKRLCATILAATLLFGTGLFFQNCGPSFKTNNVIVSEAASLADLTTPPVSVPLIAEKDSTLILTQNKLCTIDSSGVLKCIGCIYKPSLASATTSFPFCETAYTPKIVLGLPAIRDYKGECALTKDDRVLCSGINYYFYKSRMNSVYTIPYDVDYHEINLGGPVESISDTADNVCALLKSGIVKCWGNNASGHLGNGTIISSYDPVTVVGVENVKLLHASGTYLRQYCAYQADGKIMCWGRDLLNPSTSLNQTPVQITQIMGVKQMASGSAGLFCLLLDTGKISCMTSTSTSSAISFAEKTGLAQVKSMSGSSNAVCATDVNDQVKCWGMNYFGRLGFNYISSENVADPHLIPQWSSAKTIVGGNYATCAQLANQSISCSGYNIASGVIDRANRSLKLIPGLGTVDTAKLFQYSGSCARDSVGKIKCWDSLFSNMDFSKVNPYITKVGDEYVLVPQLEAATDINKMVFSASLGDANYKTSGCFVNASSQVICWGYNNYGQLGNGDISLAGSVTPIQVVGVANATLLKEDRSAGAPVRCALTQDKKLLCWGYNLNGTFASVTPQVLAENVVDFELSYTTIAVIFADGTVKTAINGNFSVSDPLYNSLTNVKKLFSLNFCAQHYDNTVSCMKYSATDGQPTGFEKIVDLTNVKQLYPMRDMYCASLNSGGAKCWGDNSRGQLGQLDLVARTSAVTPMGITDVKSFFQLDYRACAQLRDDRIICWGDDYAHSNISLAAAEMTILRGLQPVIAPDGTCDSFIDPVSRALLTYQTIRISAIPLLVTFSK